MSFRISLENDLLRIEFAGSVTKADLASALQEVERIEAAHAVVPHRLTDMLGWKDSENHYPEIAALVARRKARKFPNAFKSAIVASRPAQVGMARMFQTLNDHPQITIEIFSDLAAARAWLAAPPSAPPHS